jgi:short-subunit dehydrogenase
MHQHATHGPEGTPLTSTAEPDVPGIDRHHLLVIGAGPGLGAAIARRFAHGRYRVTLLARDLGRLAELARELRASGAAVDTVAADASDPAGFQAAVSTVYAAAGAPGLMVYNAVLAGSDTLLDSDISHLQRAYNVDVVSAIVAARVAAEAMRAAGGGTILFTGGGFADRPVASLATVSLGKAALRSAATMLGDGLAPGAVRVASLTVAGVIAEGTPFSPARIADAYWTIAQSDGNWQSEFRFDGTATAAPARPARPSTRH